MTAVILAGGIGSRLRQIHPNTPKPMIPLGGAPFLEWVLRYWKRQGVNRFVISLGHLAKVATDYLAARPQDGGIEIVTVIEPEAMGTGGAVRFAARHAELSDPFVVANGDSLVIADCSPAIAMLQGADGVLLGVEIDDAARFGSLDIGPGGRLTGFREKEPGAGVINGGVYFLRKSLLEEFEETVPLSIERDVFPRLLRRNADLRVHTVRAPFLDIGTPESLAGAEEFLQTHAHH